MKNLQRSLDDVLSSGAPACRRNSVSLSQIFLHIKDGLAKAWFKSSSRNGSGAETGLGEAILYMQKYWDKLTLFLRQAGAPLDNNIVERTLKILHRKNALPGGGMWTRVLPTQMTFGLCVMVVLRPGYFPAPTAFHQPRRFSDLAENPQGHIVR